LEQMQEGSRASVPVAASPTSPLEPVVRGNSSGGKLSDYEVLKAVGKGGYSVVYKGTRRRDNRMVAVKKVEIFDMAPKKRERCLQEVQLLQTCKHPNIIQMLDAFIEDNQLIIVFEWAPAGDLKRLVRKTAEAGKALEEGLIWNYFYQIADAVRFMHKKRVMHRDIKPANVLVGANGALKLGDLGLGRHFSENTNEVFSKVGTPYYVSPEVVKGDGYDWKSDVWSLGCLLYELAALRSPFEMEGANLYDVFQKINAGDYRPLPRDQYSKVLRDLVTRMLQTDPARRPEMEEVWRITRGFFEHQHQASRSTHLICEQATDKLTLLATEVRRQLLARQAISSPPSGEDQLLSPPPRELFRTVHPLYFAESLGGRRRRRSSKGAGSGKQLEGSPEQFELAIGTISWLLRLVGQAQESRELEADFSLASESGEQLDEESRVRLGDRVRAVCVAIGLEADFATAQGIAAGCGRTVCTILDSLADTAIKTLGIRAREPRRADEPRALVAEEIDEDLELPEEELLQADCLEPDDSSEEERGGGGGHGRAGSRGIQRSASTRLLHSEVDAEAWQAETERLAPELGRIAVQSQTAGQFGAWQARYHTALRAKDAFEAAGPKAAEEAGAWAKAISAELDAIHRREEEINREWSAHTLSYAQSRNQLGAGIHRRDMTEARVAAATTKLADLMRSVEDTEQVIAERRADFDGSHLLAELRSGIESLRAEAKALSQSSELAHIALLSKQAALAHDSRIRRR